MVDHTCSTPRRRRGLLTGRWAFSRRAAPMASFGSGRCGFLARRRSSTARRNTRSASARMRTGCSRPFSFGTSPSAGWHSIGVTTATVPTIRGACTSCATPPYSRRCGPWSSKARGSVSSRPAAILRATLHGTPCHGEMSRSSRSNIVARARVVRHPCLRTFQGAPAEPFRYSSFLFSRCRLCPL